MKRTNAVESKEVGLILLSAVGLLREAEETEKQANEMIEQAKALQEKARQNRSQSHRLVSTGVSNGLLRSGISYAIENDTVVSIVISDRWLEGRKPSASYDLSITRLVVAP